MSEDDLEQRLMASNPQYLARGGTLELHLTASMYSVYAWGGWRKGSIKDHWKWLARRNAKRNGNDNWKVIDHHGRTMMAGKAE